VWSSSSSIALPTTKPKKRKKKGVMKNLGFSWHPILILNVKSWCRWPWKTQCVTEVKLDVFFCKNLNCNSDPMGGARGNQKKEKRKRWPSSSLATCSCVWPSSSSITLPTTGPKKAKLELELFFARILR
jgi:hypothetical protein